MVRRVATLVAAVALAAVLVPASAGAQETQSPAVDDGTDVPFNWPVTVDLVLNAKFLSDAEKTAILSGNLTRLLRIE